MKYNNLLSLHAGLQSDFNSPSVPIPIAQQGLISHFGNLGTFAVEIIFLEPARASLAS